jgi:SAM-dependent methyltransferase
MFFCENCDAFFSNGGYVNYDDVNLIDYYLSYEDYICTRQKKLFTFVKPLLSPKRFLDIGAGAGLSLTVANKFGWSSAGIEPNKSLADYAVSRKLNMHNGYLNTETTGEYEMILMDNVLEHIIEPIEFLSNAKRLLASSGLLVIAVPPLDWMRKSLGTVEFIRSKIKVPQLNIFSEVDEHVNLLSRTAMGHLLHNAGLRLMDIRFHHSPLINNFFYRSLGLDDGYYFVVHA